MTAGNGSDPPQRSDHVTGRLEQAERVSHAFVQQHGVPPTTVWSAPGRVNIIGEHTDYNDGLVLPCALPHRISVAAKSRVDDRITVATTTDDGRVQSSTLPPVANLQPGTPKGWVAYPSGVVWTLHQAGYPVSGADIVIAGNVPSGAGLSSSHALECAIALALLEVVGYPVGSDGAPSLDELALLIQRAENDFVGAPTGLLDQTASLCCAASHALFFDVRSHDQEQIPFDPRRTGLELLVIDTRVKHSHSESAYGQRRASCEHAAEFLGVPSLREVAADTLPESLDSLPGSLRPIVRHVVTENQRVRASVAELRAGQYAELGPLMLASHRSLRDDYQVSCRELDLAVDTAVAAGALGARMTGGGFGGSAIALVPSEARERVDHRILSEFQQNGFSTPRLITAVPAAGAGKDR